MRHISTEEFKLNHTAVALGKFEGIHLGHRLLIDEINRLKKRDFLSVVFTFDRPPASVLHTQKNNTQIFTKNERSAILEEMGIDLLIEHPFTRTFAAMSPETFVRKVLVGRLGARRIVVGTDFRFGRNRSGSVDTLLYLAGDCDFEVIVIEKLKKDGEDVSTTRVRRALLAADMEEVEALLGRPYTLSGRVIPGKKLGRKLGVPSANMTVAADKCTPPDGVYLTSARYDGRILYGVTNIGLRPTVDQDGIRNAETHFLDFEGDLYDIDLCLSFHEHLRPEKKFDSLEALKMQLQEDIVRAEEIIGRKEKV